MSDFADRADKRLTLLHTVAQRGSRSCFRLPEGRASNQSLPMQPATGKPHEEMGVMQSLSQRKKGLDQALLPKVVVSQISLLNWVLELEGHLGALPRVLRHVLLQKN